MNKKGQNLGQIIEALISIIFLIAVIPIFFQLISLPNQPQPTINSTAIEQAQNLSQQLAICQTNYNQLKNSTVTKGDLQDLIDVISQINKNVITIYETNNNYIRNYFFLTIELTLTITIVFSIGIITLLDWTVFKFELSKGFSRALKRRFSKKEVTQNS